ncbi:hypothetical protein OFN71_15435, partial [Escherichia coli]|nr:hypothetical protein [Escherichia coli]
ADRNRSHWSTSKTPSYTKSVSWHHHHIFKPDIDPLQVNINIAALGGYYLINQHTLGLVYHISMVSPQALEARRKVIKETLLSWLLVDPSSTAHE